MPRFTPCVAVLAATVGLSCSDDKLQGRPGATLLGRVCDTSDGSWLGDIPVTVAGPDSVDTTTGADGTYRVDGLEPGEYRIIVNGVERVEKATLAAGQTIDLSPERCVAFAGVLEGRICNDGSNAWADGATVSATSSEGTVQTTTDENGYFRLEGLPPGDVEVQVSGPLADSFQANSDGTGTTVVGDTSCGAPVEGRICGGDNFWLADATVSVTLDDGTVVTTTSNAEGYFTFEAIPAGTYTATVTKGSFENTFEFTVGSDPEVVLPEPVCVIPDKNVAVVTGLYDRVEDVLFDIGFEERETFGGFFPGVANPDGKVDIIEGGGSYWLTTFLADRDWMNEYDIIFFNCGLSDFSLLLGGETVDQALANLADYVADGHSIYVSDWASEVVNLAFPGRVDFYGNGTSPEVTRQGKDDSGLAAVVTDPGMQSVLGSENVTLNLDLPNWVVLDPGPSQPSDVHIAVLSLVELMDGSTQANTPLMVFFEHGEGRVLYTSFHNEGQNTEDLDAIMNYVIFEL